jgi:hypothetical protein
VETVSCILSGCYIYTTRRKSNTVPHFLYERIPSRITNRSEKETPAQARNQGDPRKSGKGSRRRRAQTAVRN